MSRRLGGVLPIAAAVLLVACSGGAERSLSEDRTSPVPTGTAPIFQRSPLPPSPVGSPGASPTAATATPGAAASPTVGGTPQVQVAVTPVAEPFEVTVSEAVNIRNRPSTSQESAIVAGLYPGFKAKVVGQAQGQEVEPGKGNLWYQVEITSNGNTVRGFVYVPLVTKVQ